MTKTPNTKPTHRNEQTRVMKNKKNSKNLGEQSRSLNRSNVRMKAGTVADVRESARANM